jgi:hypothetical protein
MLMVAISVLLCICAAQAIWIDYLRKKLRRAEREIASWKLAVESYEKEDRSW